MGIVIFIAFVLVIGILGYLLVYSAFKPPAKPAIPPYQEPLVEKPPVEITPDTNWPFPRTKP